MPPTETYQLFVYGSLLSNVQITQFIRPNLQSEEAVLENYARVIIAGYHYPAVRHSPGSSVLGRVIFGIRARELKRLDVYESTDTNLYYRDKVSIRLVDDSVISAYIFLPGKKLLQKMKN